MLSLRTLAATLAVLLMAAFALAGCAVSASAFCEERHACIGGTSQDIEACEVTFDGRRELASIQGCDDEYDEHARCFLDGATCEDRAFGFGCGSDDDCAPVGGRCDDNECVGAAWGPADDACDIERTALIRCASEALAID